VKLAVGSEVRVSNNPPRQVTATRLTVTAPHKTLYFQLIRCCDLQIEARFMTALSLSTIACDVIYLSGEIAGPFGRH
jgi:hypothetical protein